MNTNTLRIAAASIAVLLLTISTADARHRHRHVAAAMYGEEVEQVVSHPAGCPRTAFCGCGVSVRIWGHPVRKFFPASAYFGFPHASPGPGMVAVRNHHVMYIERMDGNGNAIVYDPNSGGHQTRVHTRSLNGYSIRNPGGGGQMALSFSYSPSNY